MARLTAPPGVSTKGTRTEREATGSQLNGFGASAFSLRLWPGGVNVGYVRIP